MMVPDAIRYYLADQGITATSYVGFMAADPDTAYVITPTPGLPPDAKHNYNSLGIQVRTRAATYTGAETLSYSIFDRLQSASTITLSGVYIVDIQAQQDPFSLGRDERMRHAFAQNFIIDYYLDIGNRQ
jgi:Bacteriophage minor capsid protein